jgi:hypothetical protein
VTGADQNPIPTEKKTGARNLEAIKADELKQREKQILLRRNVCAYLTCLLPSNYPARFK